MSLWGKLFSKGKEKLCKFYVFPEQGKEEGPFTEEELINKYGEENENKYEKEDEYRGLLIKSEFSNKWVPWLRPQDGVPSSCKIVKKKDIQPVLLFEDQEILQNLKQNLLFFLKGKDGDTWKCKELLEELDGKLVQEKNDINFIEKLTDELVPMLLSIIALDEWKMDLHEAVLGTLTNIVPLATKLNIPWDRSKTEKLLCLRLKEMNAAIDKNRDLHTLTYKFHAWKAVLVLIYAKPLSKKTVKELEKLKVSMYEYDFVCEAVERALSQT